MAAERDDELERLRQELLIADSSGDLDAHNALMRRLEALQQKRERLLAPAKPKPKATTSPAARETQDRPRRQSRPARRKPDPDDLPMVWGDGWRGIPNELARTGLFNIKQAEPRRVLDNEPIAALRHTTMFFSGPELRVRDEDVLLQCFHFQRAHRWGEPWCVSGRDFLQAMRWSDGKRGYTDLYDALLRLSKGHISILRSEQAPPPARSGDSHPISLLDRTDDAAFILKAGALLEIEIEHGPRGAASTITVVLNKRSQALWRTMGYTLVNWDQRLALSSPLARFLHRFYSSHREPFAYKVDTLRRLTGSSTSNLSKFRQLLRDALQALADVGFLSASWIDSSDLVHVRRTVDATTVAAAAR